MIYLFLCLILLSSLHTCVQVKELVKLFYVDFKILYNFIWICTFYSVSVRGWDTTNLCCLFLYLSLFPGCSSKRCKNRDNYSIDLSFSKTTSLNFCAHYIRYLYWLFIFTSISIPLNNCCTHLSILFVWLMFFLRPCIKSIRIWLTA